MLVSIPIEIFKSVRMKERVRAAASECQWITIQSTVRSKTSVSFSHVNFWCSCPRLGTPPSSRAHPRTRVASSGRAAIKTRTTNSTISKNSEPAFHSRKLKLRRDHFPITEVDANAEYTGAHNSEVANLTQSQPIVMPTDSASQKNLEGITVEDARNANWDRFKWRNA